MASKTNPSGYKLFNIWYDLEKAKVNIDDKPIIMATQPATNDSNHESNVSITVSYSKTTSHKWGVTNGTQNGLNLQIQGKIPVVEVGASVSVSSTTTFSGKTDKAFQEKVEASVNASVTLPEKSSVIVSIVAKKQEIDVPFTAEITTLLSDGKE